MRKHSIRITIDPATEHAIETLARQESRATANMALALIKCGLEVKRAQQRIEADRNTDRA